MVKTTSVFARLFKLLRQVQGKSAAQEIALKLEVFLGGKSTKSLQSVHEAGEDLITLHSLDVPYTLHRSLMSTNAIENSFRNTRNKLGRFQAETSQASYPLAVICVTGGRERLPKDLL